MLPPSTYGLRPEGIVAEAERLTAAGWLAWEVRQRLVRPGGER